MITSILEMLLFSLYHFGRRILYASVKPAGVFGEGKEVHGIHLLPHEAGGF